MNFCGADKVIETLLELNVTTVFGYPGGAILPIYDSLFKSGKIRHILTRHEQGAVHAAQGYARATGKVGVVFATSGPGATNLVTGIADAFMDSTPIVAITGQVPRHMIGTDGFQETDITSITRQITKHNYLVDSPEKINLSIKEAFFIAQNGRGGPVLVDIPKDVQQIEGQFPSGHFEYGFIDKYQSDFRVEINEAIEAIEDAKKPVFYVGGGLRNASDETIALFAEFAKKFNIPVASTTSGLGGFSAKHDNFIGLTGMHGTYESNMAINKCDLLVGFGVRFADRVTGIFRDYAPNAKIIQIDIDKSSVNKNVSVDIPIFGSLNDVIPVLHERVGFANDMSGWWGEINAWKSEKKLEYKVDTELVKPQYFLDELSKQIQDTGDVITTDVGQHQMWAAQYIQFTHSKQFISSLGLGTMGFGLPSAIGAQIGLHEAGDNKNVICISGDGSIMMNIQELATAFEYKTNVKVVILNNNYLGMVKQWQDLFYENRYSSSEISSYTDFTKIAESFGIKSKRITSNDNIQENIKEMLAWDGNYVLDVIIPDTETSYSTNLIPHAKEINQDRGTYLISIFSYNETGVLARVCNMLSSNMYNIESLSAGELTGGVSYLNVIVTGAQSMLKKTVNNIYKIVAVCSVAAFDANPNETKHSYFLQADINESYLMLKANEIMTPNIYESMHYVNLDGTVLFHRFEATPSSEVQDFANTIKEIIY